MRTTGREMRPVQAGAYRPRKARHTPASRELVKKVPLFLAPFIRQAADTPPGRLFAAVKKADVRARLLSVLCDAPIPDLSRAEEAAASCRKTLLQSV